MLADASIVHGKLCQLQLRRPRQWGACWLALLLCRELQLDLFWSQRLGVSRKGTRWDQVLFVLQAVFDHLVGRWRDLFNISYDVLLYDLTSTYFEADPPFPEVGTDGSKPASSSAALLRTR